jgi:L-threonylcarbamoyladenylate synthase
VSKSGIENSRAKEPRAEPIFTAVAALERGDVIVFPTETLYGLGADALNGAAVEKVFKLKGRDPNNPIPVLVSNSDMLFTLVAEVPPLAEPLMARFWPGPLTVVFPARDGIPRPLVNTGGGIGVRISSQPVAAELLQALGRPLTATSANPSGNPPARTVEAAKGYFAGRIDIFVDAGELTSQIGSTVVEIVGERLRLVRAGDIGIPEIEAAVGPGRIMA